MGLSLREQRDRASLAWLAAMFALLPVLVVFGHRGVAPWLLLVSFPAFVRGDFWQTVFGALFDQLDLRNPVFAAMAAIIGFSIYIVVSGFWSPKGQLTLGFYVLGPVLVGAAVVWFSLHLPRIWSYRLGVAFAVSVAVGMGVLLAEGLTSGFLRSILPPNDATINPAKDMIALGRGVTALAPALFPAAIIASLFLNRYAALGLLILGAAAAFTNEVSANAIAIALGLVASVCAFKAPSRILPILGWSFIALLLLVPFAAFLPVDAIFSKFGNAAPPSWLHRIAIWQSVGARIGEGLPFGFGADFARIWKESAPLISVPGTQEPLSLMPTHPHNLFLQIWLEFGLVGAGAVAAFFHYGATSLNRASLPAPVLAGLVGALTAIMVSIMVEGSLWQVWRLAAMALAGMGVALSLSLHKAYGLDRHDR